MWVVHNDFSNNNNPQNEIGQTTTLHVFVEFKTW